MDDKPKLERAHGRSLVEALARTQGAVCEPTRRERPEAETEFFGYAASIQSALA